jgi:hypothetical protein
MVDGGGSYRIARHFKVRIEMYTVTQTAIMASGCVDKDTK